MRKKQRVSVQRKSLGQVSMFSGKVLRYAAFGAIGVATDVVLYQLLISSGVFLLIANTIGYATGTVVSFFLNRKFNFKVLNRMALRGGLFFGIALSGMLISNIILGVLTFSLNFAELPAKILTLMPVFVWQFALNNFVTFRSSTSLPKAKLS